MATAYGSTQPSNILIPIEAPDPLKAFRFVIKVGDGQQVSAAFAQCSCIQMQVETLQFRSGDDNRGVRDYTPVFTGYAPISFTKGVVGDHSFWSWILEAAADVNRGPKGSNLRRTVVISALDEHGKAKVEWTLRNAMPVGYELSAMDSSRSEILMESVSFVFTGLERSVLDPEAPAKPAPRKKVSPSPIQRKKAEPREKVKPSPIPRKVIEPRQKPNPSPIPRGREEEK